MTYPPAASGAELLRTAWDAVADGYADYFTARFQPWLDDLLAEAVVDDAVAGPVAVACCGPGVEVQALAHRFPQRRVVAVDLSPRMVALTQRRTRDLLNVETHVGDASTLREVAEPAALIASAFGLQQMPAPLEVLAAWTRALAEGGTAHVLFWPSDTEEHGPFELGRRLIRARWNSAHDPWEDNIDAAIVAAGGEVVAHQPLQHAMHHDSAETLWTHMVHAGSWAALRLRVGDEALEELHRAFVEQAPRGPLSHHPRARWLRFRRR